MSSNQSFSYDHVNRLTSSGETGSKTWTRNYGFDAWANAWVTSNSGLTLNSFTPVASTNFDALTNRLNIQGATYNAAGDQTAIGGYANTYDAENRLTQSTIGGVATTYVYDEDGRRVSKASGGVTTNYVYDAAGALAAEYTSAVEQASPCGNCYLTADPLGSTRMVTDETAMPRECHDFLPFGEEISRTAGCYAAATSNTLKFSGKERDTETGNDYFGARYLASMQMRWTIPDWSARGEAVPYAKLDDPQTLNLYGYVGNDPLSHRDLDGHVNWNDVKCVLHFGSCKQVEPPKAPAPAVTPHAFETARINKLTVRQVANIVANENRDVVPGPSSGQKLHEAKTAQANAVMNADRKFGSKRETLVGTAPTKVSPALAGSPQYEQALDAASTALQQQNTGADPTGGRTYFNNRFNEDLGPRTINHHQQTVFNRYGPFSVGGGPVYTLIYNDPK